MKTIKLIICLLFLGVFSFTSCTKDDTPNSNPVEDNDSDKMPDEPEEPSDPFKDYSVKTNKSGTLVIGDVFNLYAGKGVKHGDNSSGEFTKFDFSAGIGKKTDSSTEWDIAMRGTTIIINGGSKVVKFDKNELERTGNAAAYVADAYFDDVTTVDIAALKQDSSEGWAIPIASGNGWYSYSMQTHIITPIPKRTLVFRTRDGKNYVKVEILTYYKDYKNDTGDLTTARYYTFKYEYQTVADKASFETTFSNNLCKNELSNENF